MAFFLGRRLEDTELSEEKFSVLWGIPIFASDAISSVSYAGEEVLLVLVPVLAYASFRYFLPIVAAIICLLGILVFCYRQTIEAYPEGDGAYIVASDNLGEKIGLIAGGSLIMDYILTVAVSSCAGAAAITSAFPSMLPYKALLAFLIICLLTLGNLRGIRDSSVMFGVPTYLFILTMLRIKRHYERVNDDLTLSSDEMALAEINRDKTARVIIPVQSLNKSFIKTLNCALSCGFASMELYSVCSTEENALRIKEQIEALGVDCDFRYDVTTLRNTNEILLNHIRQEADADENRRLIVMMGGLVVRSPHAKILHNSTTHRLMKKMETYRNVYIISVPYVIE